MAQDMKKMTDEAWRGRLTPEQYKVLREAGTEPPFSGEYVDENSAGVYTCGACGGELFSSDTKFESHSGWPSFYDVVEEGAVELREDASLGQTRVEVVCARCGSHLGHLFDDGPTEMPDGTEATGKRYCINSLALCLESAEPSEK